MFGSTRRQEIYERIRQSSKQEYILEEMIRLGFWPAEGAMPDDPADEIRRRREILQRLQSLRTEQTRLKNTARMLRDIKRKRMADSKQRQKETKARCENKRVERAKAWRQRQATDITYLGQYVSAGLSQRTNAADSPHRTFASPAELAQVLGITINTLRFLSYNRDVSTVTHYVRFTMPKKTGGVRQISAPMPTLKYVQHRILDLVLSGGTLASDSAHGFIPDRSIVTNAQPHLGAKVVINMDLEDFFPSITYKRVRGLFVKMGHSEAIATILAMVCTEPDVDVAELDGKTWYVANGPRKLPQGAPTSPAITNLICQGLDRSLNYFAGKYGFTFTRYADDLTFSSKDGNPAVAAMMGAALHTIRKHGFTVNSKKTRVQRQGCRQEVTGLVVNDKLGVPRKKLKAFRATLFQIEKDGYEGKSWGNGGHILNAIWGFASYVHMVDPEKGMPLQERVKAIHQKYNWKTPAFSTDRPVNPPSDMVGTRTVNPFNQDTEPESSDTVDSQAAAAKPAKAKQNLKSSGAKEKPDQEKPWWKLW